MYNVIQVIGIHYIQYSDSYFFFISIPFIYLFTGHTWGHVGSYFPNQGSNPSP